MNLLCIGQSGQVARALAERSADRDISCVCIGRPDLDLTDPDSLARSVARIAPDLVINAAAYTAVDRAEAELEAAMTLNAEGPAVLAGLCAARDLPLIHLSTDYVFDGTSPNPYTESDTTKPINAYGTSKLAGEQAIRAALPQHIILRTSWVYSPFGSNFVKTMLRLASERGAASVVDDQIGAPTSAHDIADAVLDIAAQIHAGGDDASYGTYHYAAAGTCSWADFAALIFRVHDSRTGCSTALNRIASSAYPTPAARPANSRLATRKLESAFGITSKDWTHSAEAIVNRLLDERT